MEPVAIQPVAIQPVAIQPVAIQPVAIQPVAIQPVAIQPVAIQPVAILAGGLGTRMAQHTGPSLPKALLPVAGHPFIDFKLAQLAAQGVSSVVLLTGHGSEALAEHVGDGSAHGLEVTALADGEVLLGTGGALRRALALLGPTFWVTYGDTLLSVPLARAEEALRSGGRPGLMTVLRNQDAGDASNVAIRGDLVVEYRKGAPPGTFDYIDYGMNLLTPGALEAFPPGPFDLGAVFQGLIARACLTSFVVQERFYEIGSPAGYAETERYLRSWPAWLPARLRQ